MNTTIRYADSKGVAIAWTEWGSGPPDIAMIPGFISHLELLWDDPAAARFRDRLASCGRLLHFDKREQGLSDRLGRPPTLEETMDDLHAVLDAAGSERVALIGVSEGGPMAALFAATFPDRVSHLVIYGSYARIVRADDNPGGIPVETLRRFFAAMDAHWGEGWMLRWFAPSVAGDPGVQAWAARLLRSGASPAGARSLMRMYEDLDVRDVLPAIRVPTLVIHRSGDLISPVEQGRDVARRIPGARYVELPGVDHLPFWENADAILDETEEFVTGQRQQRQPDRVLATVLFTDICRSTERAAQLGDRRWRDLLAAHDGAVRREVERRRGRMIKSTGDGALATFDGPARAIEGAQAIREAVERLGLEIRAGLHTGECELIGEDVGGLAVHIGARVAATANPGEIRVSRTVADLVAGSGLRFEDRGEHALKGVPGVWRLLAVADGRAREAAAA